MRSPALTGHLVAGLCAALWCTVAAAQSVDDSAPPAAPPASSAADSVSSSASRVPTLEIEADSTIRDLLGKYLDLARAMAQADAVSFSEFEWSRLIAATPEQARNLLQPLGYFEAQVSIEKDDATPPKVTLRVTPGRQAHVGRLTLEIQGELADRADADDEPARTLRSALRQGWPLEPGSPFTNAAWGSAKSEVIARLRAQGYAAAAWAGTTAQVDPPTAKVRLFMVVDSGPLFRAGDIAVEGLVHHELSHVQALAPFERGDALTEKQLGDYQQRLQKTGLFDQVNVSLDPDTAQADHARVLVQLRESARQSATLALGYSANAGPRVTLEHVQRRLFDWPLTARNKWLWGRDEQSWDGELATHPDADFGRWSLGVTIDRLLTDSDLVLSQRLRAGRSRDHDGLERFFFVEAERARECARDGGHARNCEDVDALSGQVHLTWRALDNVLLPTQGYTLQWQLGAGMARGSQSTKGPFGRLYGRATVYWPLGLSWYGQARLEAGEMFAADDVQVPDSLRFRAGGDDSVRGYGWRTLAPTTLDGSLTGGRVMWTASAELARPFTRNLPSVWWAVFADAGRAANSWRTLQPAFGYGVGVRWRSPVGPLKLDLAWGNENKAMRLHLSVGIAF